MTEEHFDDARWQYGIKTWSFDVGAPAGDPTAIVYTELHRVHNYVYARNTLTQRSASARGRRRLLKRRKFGVREVSIWVTKIVSPYART